jgi:flagellar L-ring protein FlgH
MRLLAIPLAAALCAGCSYMQPRVEISEPTQAMPAPPPMAPPANGAIFQGVSYRPLFEDHRARLAGDTLVINIVEKVSASQKSTSKIDKSSDITGGITALPGVNATKVLGRASVGANAANAFNGKGETENTNDFSGTITVTVRQVLPNGHLIVAGEKQIGVNANVDVLRFSGQVDPRAIQPGNSVASTQIANVRLEHRGRGAQADAQAVGWLQRVFLSVVSPL